MELFKLNKISYPVEDLLDGKIVCGVDEAGRGSLAGPVVIASVVLPLGYRNPSIIDSKKLSDSKRKELYEIIKKVSLDHCIVEISNDEIDKLNILGATKKGMFRAIKGIREKFDLCLIDGNQSPELTGYSVKKIVKGDALSLNIAAASILAKVYRDEKMKELSKEYSGYEFEKNKGYGTKRHLELLLKNGASPIHRKSFAPVRKVLNAGKIYE